MKQQNQPKNPQWYLETLQKDETGNGYFIKIPIKDYDDLGLLQYYVSQAIKHTATAGYLDNSIKRDDILMTIETLSNLLNGLIPYAELEYLTKLQKEL